MSEITNYQLKFVEYGSLEYQQAAQLRYRLFYQEHSIPFESIFTPQEPQNLHLVITTRTKHQVLAYGRLDRNSSEEFQICQMVVEPEYQRQGLGKLILTALTQAAIDQGASLITLNARITQVEFYRKYGFESIGAVFSSSSTGVPHIKMHKSILRS